MCMCTEKYSFLPPFELNFSSAKKAEKRVSLLIYSWARNRALPGNFRPIFLCNLIDPNNIAIYMCVALDGQAANKQNLKLFAISENRTRYLSRAAVLYYIIIEKGTVIWNHVSWSAKNGGSNDVDRISVSVYNRFSTLLLWINNGMAHGFEWA